MIKHVVAFKLKPMTPEQEEALFTAFHALKDQIPELHSYSIGRNVSDRDQTYSHCLVAECDDMEAVGRYVAHPVHKAVTETYLYPFMESRMIVDYEFTP
jgi:hypothetical protein